MFPAGKCGRVLGVTTPTRPTPKHSTPAGEPEEKTPGVVTLPPAAGDDVEAKKEAKSKADDDDQAPEPEDKKAAAKKPAGDVDEPAKSPGWFASVKSFWWDNAV